MPDGTFSWTDGQRWEGGYKNWRAGQPDNGNGVETSIEINYNYEGFGRGFGLWNDKAYDARRPYVCQYLDLTKLDVCSVCGSS